LSYKHIGVMSLTGHVTSSVTWPFDTPYANFLLVVLWNQSSISNRFQGIQRRM